MGGADAVVGELLDQREQAGVVVAAVAFGAQRAEALLHEAGDRERHAVRAARLERDVEVLVMEVDPEAGREVMLEDLR
jgi:hypothetical protein